MLIIGGGNKAFNEKVDSDQKNSEDDAVDAEGFKESSDSEDQNVRHRIRISNNDFRNF